MGILAKPDKEKGDLQHFTVGELSFTFQNAFKCFMKMEKSTNFSTKLLLKNKNKHNSIVKRLLLLLLFYHLGIIKK